MGDDFLSAVTYSGTAGNWCCEAKFKIFNTLNTARRTLNIGDIIGFELWYNDSDDKILFSSSYVREFLSAWMYSGPANNDASHFGDLLLVGEPAPSIEVLSPNGGEVLIVNQPFAINWKAFGISGNIRIQLSTDGGAHFDVIKWHEPNDGTCDFVPEAYHVSDNCIIKVRSVDDMTIQDDSDAPFSIIPESTKPIYHAKRIPSFINTPVLDGVPDEPIWDYVSYAELKFGGVPESWGTPWSNFADNRVSFKSLWSEAENKIYVAVFVEDDIRGTLDHSNPASPNFIPWKDDCIEFYTDGNLSGGVYKDTYAEAQQWLLTELGHIALTSYPDITKYHAYTGDALSYGYVQGLNGDWAIEAEMKIFNQFPTNQRTLALNDIIGWNVWYDDSDDHTLVGGLYNRDKQVGWYYEGKSYHDADYFGHLKLEGNIPYIHVLSPNGGESYACDCSITWESHNTSGAVKIQYLDHVLWKDIVQSTVDDGQYDWTIPKGKILAQSKIRIVDVADQKLSDESDDYFSIDCPSDCRITITYPNGGETIGCNMEITWTSVNAGNHVGIRYFCKNVWHDVVLSTPNDGSFDWHIPANTKCSSKIKIINLASTGCWDMSDGYFTIDCEQSLQGHIYVSDANGCKGEDINVDIRIDGNPDPIEAFGLVFTYCPDKLTVVNAEAVDLTKDFQFFEYNVLTPGNLNIGGFNATGIPANSAGVVARVKLHIKECQEGETCVLSVKNMVDDLESFIVHNGTFLCEPTCLLGDVNMDDQITPGDALCAFNIYMNGGFPTPGSDCDNECALYSAEVNCTPDGITPGDALYIFRAYMQGKLPPLDCDPSRSALTRGKTPEGVIEMRILSEEKPGYLSCELSLRDVGHLAAFGFDLGYPDVLLSYESMTLSDVTRQWDRVEVREATDGVLRIGGYTMKSVNEENSVSLITLTFKIMTEQGEGEIWLFNLTDDIQFAKTTSSEFDIGSVLNNTGVVAEGFKLFQNYPNPFNPETELSFHIPRETHVRLTIYNTLGSEIRTLTDKVYAKGLHTISWDGCDDQGKRLSSGIYFYRLKTDNFMETKKMSLLQ
ncbi:T9SS type A sorting domain-containing protein [candidate division KSB1 bacterium]|nr:T9SS type A sorting domain-containing protein [candidate division KSB1 bacterium]